MIEAGVVGPLKAVKTALVDATHSVCLQTTSVASVIEAEEQEKPARGRVRVDRVRRRTHCGSAASNFTAFLSHVL